MIRRWPALAVIAALLVGAGLADRGHAARQSARRDEQRVQTDQPLAAPMAIAAPAGALSSTWYCAAGTATTGGDADISVTVANPGARALPTEVTVVSDTGRSRSRIVTAPSHGQVRVLLRSILSARFVAALVEVRGGEVSVDREVSGRQGYDAGPCASSSADHWYFAAGSTVRGAEEYLALFNPFPDDTSVDLTFVTEQGERSPRRLQAVPVPGRSLRIVHLNAERVNRHPLLAAQVIARSGRLVVDRLQLFSGIGAPVGSPAAGGRPAVAPRGLAVSAGVTRPVTSWAFPEGLKAPGTREQIVVSNPSDRDASLDVGVTLDDPVRNGRLDPFPVPLPAHDVKVFDVTAQDTVPDNVGHSITVHSSDGVPVVAEQVFFGGPPWSHRGAVLTTGSALEAKRWLFASGDARRDTTDEVVVQNLSGRTIQVGVTVLGRADTVTDRRLAGIEVAALGRKTIRLDPLNGPNLAVELRASEPVVAARALYRNGQPGVSISVGVPLPDGARVLQPR